MANAEINDLTAKTTPDETDELEIQETSGGLSKKITRANFIPDSSTTVKGKVELATSAETTTGTDTERATTPAGVKAVADTKANTSHTHAASDVNSGVLANARIATGTPDGTKFLRDDQVWTAIPGGGDALTANPLSQFAATTSAQLRGVLSDETGTGAAVFADSPALVTPTGIVKGDVGLGNVDNTSDASKPVSTAQQTALDAKVSKAGDTMTGDLELTSGTASLLAWNIKGNNTSSNAGTLSMAGEDGAGVASGNVEIYGGYGQSGNANGGSVIIAAGTADGSGTDGTIQLQDGDSGFSAKMNLTALTADRTITFPDTAVNLGDIASSGDASTNTASSVDNEIALFSGTAGKTLKRASTTGILKGTSGVISAATAGTDYYNPGGTDVAIADGGTGQSTATAAFDALAPTTTQGDLIYHDGTDNVRLAKGTASQVLTMNAGATAPEWYTPSAAGGQTLYDRVVAASGGDHTTLAAAITASSAGDTIYVRSGTYSESAITSSLANLTIIGENPETTIISMGANTLTLSGARVRLQNLNLTASTGNFTLSGNYSEIQHCILSKTGNGQHLTLSGSYTALRDSEFFDTSTGGVIQQAISLSGLHASIYNCYIECRIGLSGGQWLNASGGYNKIFGTRFRTVSNASDGGLIATSGVHNQFVGNTIQDSDNVLKPVFLFNGQYAVIANNNINGYWQFVDATSASYAVITGNMVLTIYNAAQAVIAPRAIVCVGNRFSTTSGSGTQTGIALTTSSASHSIVADNFLTGFATGISIGAGVTNATIHDNNLHGILTTPMTDAGTATNAQNNVGASALHDLTTVRMKNTSGATVTAGEVVTYKAVAAGDEVTTTTAAGDTKVFGVATASITNNSYGYIQTLGKTTLLKVNGTTDIAVGDYLSTFTTAGIAQKATAGQMAFAVALEAYTTDDSSGVIDALIISPRII